MPNVQGIVRTDPMNKTQGKHIHSYSTFDESLSYRLANTLRFGDYTPSFVMEGVESDQIQVNTKDLIDSLSLKAPFKGSIRKIKESFKVPMMAILPMNWDRIYVQPSNGNDVPLDANCVIQNFPALFKDFWSQSYSNLHNNLPDSTSTDSAILCWLTALVRLLVLGEYVYSYGSLLNVSGYKSSAQFYCTKHGKESYDKFFDYVITSVFGQINSLQVADVKTLGVTPVYVTTLGLGGSSVYSDLEASSFRYLLELFRERPLSYFYGPTSLEYKTSKADFLTAITALDTDGFFGVTNVKFILPNAANTFDTTTDLTALNPNTLNLSRILSYQIVCAHFYTNSSIDAVYSAELYRQYVRTWHHLQLNSTYNPFYFSYNGVECEYDYLSGKALYETLMGNNSGVNTPLSYNQSSLPWDASSNRKVAKLAAWAAIFGFRKSLRYGDYFVGSRPRPLAPINTDVAVNSSKVSVVDITRGIQAQRFANSVMRSRQKIEEYVKSLFGKAPAPDYHNPFFLTREAEVIYGDVVQNTASSQVSSAQSRTSNFASNMGQYTFTFHNEDQHPCVYLQIISFDIKRFYSRSVDRHFLHLDRFDMFNPDFQFIGDQPIYGIELGYPQGVQQANPKFPDVFSYTTRDMEYKQRFDVCSGGFVENLPGWILDDHDLSRVSVGHLDSDFIRSYNTELDQFFLSLGGYALGSYFHFICITNNFVNAKRPMAVDPQILG